MKDVNTVFEAAEEMFQDQVSLRVGRKEYSFRETSISVAKSAGGMAQHGFDRGVRVMVIMENSVEMVQCWLATNWIGAVWVPINVKLKSLTSQHMVDTAKAKLVMIDPEYVDVLRTVQLHDRCLMYSII
jgi:crotonobetaine/carnitine-CoA ligase